MDCIRHLQGIPPLKSDPLELLPPFTQFEYLSDSELFAHLIERSEFPSYFKIRGFSASQIERFNILLEAGLVLSPFSCLVNRDNTLTLLRSQGINALSLFSEK